MPLAAHGLTKELLNRLSSAGNRPGMTTAVSGTPGAGATSTPGLSEYLNMCFERQFQIKKWSMMLLRCKKYCLHI
jgi:hypothetical protein